MVGAITAGIGSAFGPVGDAFKIGKELLRASSHATFNGLVSIAQGGNFVHGFAAGFVSSFGGSVFSLVKMSIGVQVFAGAVLGGTASVLAGGKFANGAITGAFIVLFNHYVAQQMAKPTARDGGYVKSRKYAEKFCMKMSKDAGVEVSYVVSVDSNGEELYFVEPWDQNTPKVSYNRSISGEKITERYEKYQKCDPGTVKLHGNTVTEQHHFGYDIGRNQVTTGSFNDALFSYKNSIKVYHYSTEGYYHFNVMSTNELNFIKAANYSGGFTEKPYPY